MYQLPVQRNVRLAVQDINPRGRHVLLLVHGWPLSKEIFEYQYDILPQYDIRCISYDLRGYGDSDKPYSGYGYNRMADDLYRVIQSIPCSSLTLLGFSMGGAICARYMARHRGYKVKKLVLCGAAAPSFTQTADSPFGMTAAQVDELIVQTVQDRPAMCESFGKMCFASDISTPLADWFQGLSLKAAGHAIAQSLEALRDEHLMGDLRQIHVPTMILHGKQDQVCPFQLGEEQERLISNSFLEPFAFSGHCSFIDEKEKFNIYLTEFVTKG